MKKILLILVPLTLSCSVKDAQICKFKDGREAAVSLTFDDGILDHYTLVAPKLDYNGLKATFWICGANIGTDDYYAHRLTWDMCREMAANGHEISSHSWSHKNFAKATEDEIREEVQKNDEIIERELGQKPITFCYPFNAITDAAAAIVEEGRVGVRTYQEAQGQMNTHSTAESLDAWLRKVIDNREWGVTMTHGIHDGWDQWEDEKVLWNFYERLSQKRDSVWVDTFAKVASYIAERDNCSIKVTKSWDDDNNSAGKRPDSIQVQLYADGTAYGDPVTLTSAGNWTYTWSSLPVKSNGNKIEYTVRELTEAGGYKSSVTGSAEDGFVITNTFTPTDSGGDVPDNENPSTPSTPTTPVTPGTTDNSGNGGTAEESGRETGIPSSGSGSTVPSASTSGSSNSDSASAGKSGTSSAPQTGDDMRIFLYGAVAAGSVTVLILLTAYRRRLKEEK